MLFRSGGACGRKELAADFKHADEIGDLLGKFQGSFQGIKIEGDDQAAAWMRVEVQGGWDDLRSESCGSRPGKNLAR